MKQIEIDDELYRYIASQTQFIGESASQILRRLLMGDSAPVAVAAETPSVPVAKAPAPEVKSAATSLSQLIKDANPAQHASAVKRFLVLLGILHQYHGNGFAKVLQLKGRNRVYFSADKETLLRTGSSTNPKQIPDSVYWVITNNNTTKKLTMLTQVMTLLGHKDEEIKQICEIFDPQGE